MTRKEDAAGFFSVFLRRYLGVGCNCKWAKKGLRVVLFYWEVDKRRNRFVCAHYFCNKLRLKCVKQVQFQ